MFVIDLIPVPVAQKLVPLEQATAYRMSSNTFMLLVY